LPETEYADIVFSFQIPRVIAAEAILIASPTGSAGPASLSISAFDGKFFHFPIAERKNRAHPRMKNIFLGRDVTLACGGACTNHRIKS
jgi:hypothetical protein